MTASLRQGPASLANLVHHCSAMSHIQPNGMHYEAALQYVDDVPEVVQDRQQEHAVCCAKLKNLYLTNTLLLMRMYCTQRIRLFTKPFTLGDSVCKFLGTLTQLAPPVSIALAII